MIFRERGRRRGGRPGNNRGIAGPTVADVAGAAGVAGGGATAEIVADAPIFRAMVAVTNVATPFSASSLIL